jgi:hypothetical protein
MCACRRGELLATDFQQTALTPTGVGIKRTLYTSMCSEPRVLKTLNLLFEIRDYSTLCVWLCGAATLKETTKTSFQCGITKTKEETHVWSFVNKSNHEPYQK